MTKRIVLILAVFLLASGAVIWRARSGREATPRTATPSASRATGIVPPTTEPGNDVEPDASATRTPTGLHGRVIDAGTGAGVPDADIAVLDYVAGSSRRDRTDAEGRFVLEVVPMRSPYELRTHRNGLVPTTSEPLPCLRTRS